MRGDEEKAVSPMFPRLHVNDTDREGPRAPPRNKMALYEQLSIPSQQRFSSRPPSILPLPPCNGAASLAPSTTSSSGFGGGGRKRSQFTPFCNSPAPSHSTDKLRESAKPTDHQRNLNVTRSLQPIAKAHSFQPPNFPNFRNLSIKQHGGEDLAATPTYSRSSVVSHCTDTQRKNQDQEWEQQFPLFRVSPAAQVQASERNVGGTGDKILVDTSPTLKRAHESSVQSHRSSPEEAMNKRQATDARLFREAATPRDVVKETASRPKGGNEGNDRVREAEKENDVSDSSMVDSMSVLDISPDDVVGVMGEKHFWKARKAIVNQQRVFAVQVFELHRLMKVQRLIAESAHLLLQETLSLSKPPSKAKKLPPEPVHEPLPQVEPETALPKLPLPPLLPLVNGTSKLPFYGPYSRNQPPRPVTPNPEPSPPWCFRPPPGNQWLVPVMSPSEGFVYKPYTGPGPPGLMAPVYGGYDPVNAGFGAYFPPYGAPALNPSVSDSAVEQVSPFASNPPPEDQNSNMDINLAMSSQMSRVMSCRVGRQASKESEVQGSTASSPSLRRANGEALSLFPLASDLNACEAPSTARVIRVVPHNPRSATESAARILQFIQEERKQFD